MNVSIEKIKITTRIRKAMPGVDELAKDIRKNGLINPITVMAIDGDDNYQLLAGLRRLRAAQAIGWEEIAVTVVQPKDAEAALNIEYSENEQRESFTFSEKMDYARLIDEIEKAKALERMSFGGQGKDVRPYLEKGQRRENTGRKIGMSGRQYERAKYVAEHAPQNVIDKLDQGERTIYRTYMDLHDAERKLQSDATSSEAESTSEESKTGTTAHPVVSTREISTPLPTPEKVPETDLQRAIRAESELDAFKYRQHNEIFHRDSIIENLNKRNAELIAALEAANARIQELEDQLSNVHGAFVGEETP